MSKNFDCSEGLRQGENLSPLLFSLYLNDVKKDIARSSTGVGVIQSLCKQTQCVSSLLGNERIHLLLHADNCIILSESTDDLQDALNSLDLYCQEHLLKINTDKTKIMVVSWEKCESYQF